MDNLSEFIKEQVRVTGNHEDYIYVTAFMELYQKWCAEHGKRPFKEKTVRERFHKMNKEQKETKVWPIKTFSILRKGYPFQFSSILGIKVRGWGYDYEKQMQIMKAEDFIHENRKTELESAIEFFGFAYPIYSQNISYLQDGGTVVFGVKDSADEELWVCLDGRKTSKDRSHGVWIGKYPEKDGSQRVNPSSVTAKHLRVIFEAIGMADEFDSPKQGVRLVKALRQLERDHNGQND